MAVRLRYGKMARLKKFLLDNGEVAMKKLLEGKRLEDRAKELGCDMQGELITQSSSGRRQRASDYELQKRILKQRGQLENQSFGL